VFHGNHLLYWSVRSEGVIYVNAYSGKIICGATSRTLSIWLDAVLSEDLHLLGQTAPGAFVAGKTVFSSCHADDENCESVLSTGLASFLLKAKMAISKIRGASEPFLSRYLLN